MAFSDEEEGGIDRDLGEATIVYEGPEEEYIQRTVPNEEVAYFQDHWIVKTGQTERGHDTIKRIPSQRVYFVERDVQQFEEEVKGLRDQVQSLANEVRSKISSAGVGSGGRQSRGGTRSSQESPIQVPISEEERDEESSDREDSSTQ